MADERDVLYEMQDKHRLPIELKAIDCKNISSEDAEQIEVSLKQLGKDLDDIKNEIDSLEETTNTTHPTIITDLKFLYN